MTYHREKNCFGVAMILMLSLACGRNASYYLEKGKQLGAQGKIDEAALSIQKALQKDSKLGPAYLELGAIYAKQNKNLEAYHALDRAVELMPDNAAAKRELADLCLAVYLSDPSRPAVLYNRMEKLSVQLLADPNSFDGHRLKGYLDIFDRKPEQAVEHLRKANEIKPNDPQVIQALTQVLFQVKQPVEAEHMALQLVEKQKDFGPIYDVLYRYYQSAQRAKEAEQLIRSKAANNPKNISFTLELAAHYARMKNRELMVATLQRLLDNPRDFPKARLEIGDFYLALGEPDQASRYYEEGIRNNPADKLDYQRRLAALLVAQHKDDQGLPILEEILKAQPDDVAARSVRAGLLLQKASAVDRERAVSEFQDLVQKNPRDAALRNGLGRALISVGKTEQARKQFVESVQLQPAAPAARLILAELALERRDYAEALTRSEEILKQYPDEPHARLIRATGLMGIDRLSEANQELNQLLKTSPNFADAELQLGQLYVVQKKLSPAEAVFRKHFTPGTGSFRAAEGLVQVYMLNNQKQKALEVLDIWKTRLAQAPEAGKERLAMAITALKLGQVQTAIDQYEALLAKDPKSSSLHRLLAQAQALNGDPTTAVATLQKAIELDPNDPSTALFLSQLLQTAGRTQEAVPLLRRVVQLQPDDAGALNNLAFALLETGSNLDEALQLAQRAQGLVPGRPEVADTLAWIYVKKNMPDSAIRILRNLVSKDPEKSSYRYHLGAALLLKGDKAAAKTELQIALGKSPSRGEEQKIRELLDSK